MTVKALLLDIGGVLLSNGWDTSGRQLAAKTFHLDFEKMESRHRLTFDTFELGKMSLRDYVEYTVFFEKRSFSPDDFEEFMYDYSDAHPDMMDLIRTLKERHNLKIGTVSNEGRELNDYRVQAFKLYEFIDFFCVSGLVHLKKPDPAIYQLAVDLSQTPKKNILYIEDRELLIEAAGRLEIPSLHHTSFEMTRQKLAERGLS